MPVRRPSPGALAALVLAALTLLASSCGTYTVVMTRDDLQRRVEARFPVERDLPLGSLTFSNPVVRLDPGSDRIGLRMDAEAAAIPLAAALIGPVRRGSVELSGGLRYEPATAELFLASPRVESLSIDGIPPRLSEDLKVLLTGLGVDLLGNRPIHKLEGRNLREKAAILALRSVEVRDGRLVATLGPR
jgi:hypothetical protein